MTATKRPLITEEILDQAIAAAEQGEIDGLTYDQGSWCGTACCVLGFARHIAGLSEFDDGPQDGEFVDTPRTKSIRTLMNDSDPKVLELMRLVDENGVLHVPLYLINKACSMLDVDVLLEEA